MPPKGRLASFLRPVGMIWFSICLHWEAFTAAVHQDGLLAALTHVKEIRDAASAKLFSVTSTGFITFEDTTIVPTLVSSASGVTLDLGPGAGNQIHNLASAAAQISHIYGVEPNPHYRVDIEAKLALEEHSALRGKYELITCGIEDSDVLREHGIEEGSVDCILCIQVLCAVKDPRSVARECWRLLRPGGKFVFWEHGGSRDGVVRVGQAVLNPAWSTFVGCRLTRNVLADILDAGEWENPGDVEEPEDRVSCMPRVQGVLVKRS